MSNILDGARDLNYIEVASGTFDGLSTTEYVLQQIVAHGFTPLVAGGYVRDTYFNQQPKDIDIIVVGHNPEDGNSLNRFATLWAKLTNLRGFHDKTGEEVDYNVEVEEDRLSAVWGLRDTSRDLPIDIIFYNCGTLNEALAQFDYNINTAYFNFSTPQWGDSLTNWQPKVGGLVKFYNDQPPIKLVQMRVDLNDTRKLKMLRKARSMGYDVGDQIDRLEQLNGDSFF
ncbi:MAG: hypothetical protein ACRC0J_07915 [Shewanella oncorhynchi]